MRNLFLTLSLLTSLLVTGCMPDRRPQPTPAPSPVPITPDLPVVPVDPVVPVAVDFSAVTQIVHAGDKAKAAELAAAWRGFAWAVQRAETIGQPVETTGQLRETLSRFERLSWLGTDFAGAFPGITAAINQALITSLGDDDRDLRPGEAATVFRLLGEACQ